MLGNEREFRGLARSSDCTIRDRAHAGSFCHGQNPILGRGLIGNWISWGSGPGGAWWELDELAVNQSILRGRRVRLMRGIWGGEQLRRKGGAGANRGSACRLGASCAGWVIADADIRTALGQGVRFLEFSQADLCAAAGTSSAARRLGRCRRHGRWGRRRPVGGSGRRGVGSVQKTGSLAAAAERGIAGANRGAACRLGADIAEWS